MSVPDPSTYTLPPDYAGRQTQINTAYNTALARLGAQQSQLYTQMGYKDGTTDLDPSQQYGSIQQLLHGEGQSLSQDDEAEAGRGLSSDSGLGAARARLIRYQAGAQKNTLGQGFQTGLTGIQNSQVDALSQYNQDTLSNSNDQATYNAGQNAYNDALAQYNSILAQQTPTGPGIPAYMPTSGPITYDGAKGKEVAVATKAKAGKVTVVGGRGHDT